MKKVRQLPWTCSFLPIFLPAKGVFMSNGKNKPGEKAIVLDENGYRSPRMAKSSSSDGLFRVELPEDALYTPIE